MKTAPVADIEALAVRLAVLRAQQASTDELEGRRRSRAAFRRWKERIPLELSEDRDVELLVERHRTYWLRSASGFVRSIDPSGFGTTDFHVLDFADLGLASDTIAGVAYPDGAFDVFRELLPRTAFPGPVVAVNVQAQARHHVRNFLETAPESDLRESVRVGITATVLHEAAHVLDFSARGETMPAVDIGTVRDALKSPPAPDVRSSLHGDNWVRGFAHLTWRSARRPPSSFWSSVFCFDVAEHYEGPTEEILDGFFPEFFGTKSTASLFDVIREKPDPSFARILSAHRKS